MNLFTTVAAGFVLAIGANTLAQRVLPVVAFMQAHDVKRDGAAIEARISGLKITACEFVPGSQIAWYKGDLGWREAGTLLFVDDVSPDSTRPAGATAQDFGIWRWPEVPLDAPQIRATILHDCYGRIVVTKIGPFDIDEGV